jgi:hypothetical protein
VRTVRARAVDALALRAQAVGETLDERGLGADDEQVRVEVDRRCGDGSGDAGVAGRDQDIGAAAEDVRESVGPPVATDDHDSHRPILARGATTADPTGVRRRERFAVARARRRHS